MNGSKVGSEFAPSFASELVGLRHHGIKGHRLDSRDAPAHPRRADVFRPLTFQTSGESAAGRDGSLSPFIS
jgi:hypothetical protein